ncbi:MAG: thioredoxin family protein, partial [Planctomycetes bacterium]|nr:thioredoxin family protein [Planctomycetota bacterium]
MPANLPAATIEPNAIAQETKPLPRLIDLGADKCIPCKMMAPILEGLKEEYAGKFEVVFFDVWKNSDAAKKYEIRIIPTQIFF